MQGSWNVPYRHWVIFLSSMAASRRVTFPQFRCLPVNVCTCEYSTQHMHYIQSFDIPNMFLSVSDIFLEILKGSKFYQTRAPALFCHSKQCAIHVIKNNILGEREMAEITEHCLSIPLTFFPLCLATTVLCLRAGTGNHCWWNRVQWLCRCSLRYVSLWDPSDIRFRLINFMLRTVNNVSREKCKTQVLYMLKYLTYGVKTVVGKINRNKHKIWQIWMK